MAGQGKHYPGVERLREPITEIMNLSRRRHPEPSELALQQIIDPALQIRGVWKRVRLSKAGKKAQSPPPRTNFASVVHKGKFSEHRRTRNSR